MDIQKNKKRRGGRTLLSVALAAMFVVAAFAIIAADDDSSAADKDAYLGAKTITVPSGGILDTSLLTGDTEFTITLNGDATCMETLKILDGMKVTIDLNGHKLTFDIDYEDDPVYGKLPGILVDDGILIVNGGTGGSLNFIGDFIGAVDSYGTSDVKITADITTDSIEASSIMFAMDTAAVSVEGNMTAINACEGIFARDSSEVKVTGNISVAGDGVIGIYAHEDAVVEVTGNIEVIGETEATGIQADPEGGNVGGDITVNGDITVICNTHGGGFGIYANESVVIVNGELKVIGMGYYIMLYDEEETPEPDKWASDSDYWEYSNDYEYVLVKKTLAVAFHPSADKVFAPVPVGYGAQAPYEVTLYNVGNLSTGALTFALSGGSSSSFTLNSDATGDMYVGDYIFLTVTPNSGLALGTYTETVTVSGTGISESFDVTFTVGAAYTLTVVNGDQSGDGTYTEGAEPRIYANAPAEGKVFDKWVITSGEGGVFGDAHEGETTFTMPAGNVTVTATYTDEPSEHSEDKSMVTLVSAAVAVIAVIGAAGWYILFGRK